MKNDITVFAIRTSTRVQQKPINILERFLEVRNVARLKDYSLVFSFVKFFIII